MKRVLMIVATVMLAGCAGFYRGCSSFSAGAFGSDWIVVQYRFDGTPINCWQLRGMSVSNEERSDGIYWLDSTTGHLVHISGWYNRVQVAGGRFDEAAKLMGIELARCTNGKY